MADLPILQLYKDILENPETAEAFLYEDALFIKRQYRDARELQTRSTYHKLNPDESPSEDNMVMMGVWARVRKNGERIK